MFWMVWTRQFVTAQLFCDMLDKYSRSRWTEFKYNRILIVYRIWNQKNT